MEFVKRIRRCSELCDSLCLFWEEDLARECFDLIDYMYKEAPYIDEFVNERDKLLILTRHRLKSNLEKEIRVELLPYIKRCDSLDFKRSVFVCKLRRILCDYNDLRAFLLDLKN